MLDLEIRRVKLVLYLWNQWRRNLINVAPVDSLEPRMILDFIDASGSKPLLCIKNKELENNDDALVTSMVLFQLSDIDERRTKYWRIFLAASCD